MGFGQLPPTLYFADKVKPREVVSTGTEYNIIIHLSNPCCQKPLADGIVPLLLPQPMIFGGKSVANTFSTHQYLVIAPS